jgi:hypothetical protein
MKLRAADGWAKLVKDWKTSGLTCKQFADGAGINAGTLMYWSTRLRKEAAAKAISKAKATSSPRRKFPKGEFIEVLHPGPIAQRSATLTLFTGRGRFEIRVDDEFNPSALTKLLDVIEERE